MVLFLLAVACGGVGPADVQPIEDVVYTAARSPIRVPTPVISPLAGSYANSVTVSVSNTAAGGTTYCALNANPQRSAAQRYLAPFDVTTSAEVRCQSFTLDGRKKSTIASTSYTITSGGGGGQLVGWAASCAAEPEPSTNVVYACDCQSGAQAGCVAGSDSNPGTKALPYRTWGKVQTAFRALPAGGTVALCKGGMFAGDTDGLLAWNNASCSAGSPCTLRDYAPTWGGTARPAVSVTASINAVQLYGNTTDVGPNGRGGYRFLNIRFFRPDGGATVASASSNGFRGADYIHDVEVCNCEVDGFGLGFYVGDSGASCRTSNWKIRGNRILNNCTDAILAGFKDTVIDGNYFDNNGHILCGSYDPFANGATSHTIYLDGRQCPEENVQVINNEFYRNTAVGLSLSDPGPKYPQGSALGVGAAQANGVTYENNYIDWTPCHPTRNGNTFVGGNGETTVGLDNIVIRRNRVKQCSGQTMTFDSAIHALIEDNVITVAGGTVSAGLIFVPQQSGGNNAGQSTIRNNTIYFAPAATVSGGFGIDAIAGNSASGHIVTGNSVTFAGTAGPFCYRVRDTSKVAYMNNNQCSGASAFATVDGFNAYSLASWRTLTGFDSASITPALTGLFVNAPTDLTPALGSPLVGASSTATTCTVLGVTNRSCSSSVAIESPTWNPLGTAKTRDGAPDIGAVER